MNKKDLLRIPIGVVAPSSRVPKIEFELGLDALRERGFFPRVHPQVRKHSLFFAGSDHERAQGFYEYARDPRFSIIWAARGGYGAARLLPLLEALTAQNGAPERKLFVGFSDSIALVDFVRRRWGWATLHGPMPGLRRFLCQTPVEWESLTSLVRRGTANPGTWERVTLSFVGHRPPAELIAPLVGGNLAVWSSLMGTPYAPSVRGKFLFLEDVDEPFYRLDRMFQQIILANGLKGVKALILGNFLGCEDSVSSVLKREPQNKGELARMIRKPTKEDLKPLRPKLKRVRTLCEIFANPCEEMGIPVAFGLPSGHGPGLGALPLGAEYSLSPSGRLKLRQWDWAKDAPGQV